MSLVPRAVRAALMDVIGDALDAQQAGVRHNHAVHYDLDNERVKVHVCYEPGDKQLVVRFVFKGR